MNFLVSFFDHAARYLEARASLLPRRPALVCLVAISVSLGACVQDESDSAAVDAGIPGGPGGDDGDTTPNPVDPNQPADPPQLADQVTFEQTLYPHLRDPANFCVSCHESQQIPTIAAADPTVAYNVVTSQEKVDIGNPPLSRIYQRVAVDNHNCGGPDSCARIAADLLAGIQAWSDQAMPPIPPSGTVLMSATTAFAAGADTLTTLSFDISGIVGGQSAITMQAGKLDDASYLFATPVLVSDVAPVQVKNIRIAVNGDVPVAAQSFRRVDVTAPESGTALSPLGAVIPIDQGPAADVFHLEFETLGNRTGLAEAVAPSNPPPAPRDVPEPAAGMRTFSQVNSTMAALTGVDTANAVVSARFAELRETLPPTFDLLAFSAAQQIAIQQLATSYCGVVVSDPASCSALFGTCTIDAAGKDAVAASLYERFVGQNLANQPEPTAFASAVVRVIDDLGCAAGCTGTAAETALHASCAAVLASGAVTIN